jgi:CRP/FNR family transcriptional regulator, cyclic AMP receptor protein
MENLERILLEHPLLGGLDARCAALVTGCAKNVRYESGAYLGREGQPCDEFFLLREGRVALEIRAPGRGNLTFQTVLPGQVLGLSWLVPPYRWAFDARTLESTRAIAIDARCLRGKCESDHDLGYQMMKRFTPVLLERLHATRVQLLDLYGKAGAAR